MMDKEIKRQIMMDHYQNPNNKQTITDDRYRSVHNASDSCIDDITVYMLIEDDVIKDVKFDGVGCTICTASTDIMCDLLRGKNIDDAKYTIEQYHHMIHEEPFDDEVLDEAIAFINTSKQAARIRCATIGWNAADEILKDK